MRRSRKCLLASVCIIYGEFLLCLFFGGRIFLNSLNVSIKTYDSEHLITVFSLSNYRKNK